MISGLQENILCLALEKRFITCEEILTELWNWKGQEQGAISKARYASAHAALSRSLTRLWAKGLIEYWKTLTRYRTGISLTAAGEEIAKAILEAEEVPVDG
jgi:DNA-binding MarR family transcriptional regulator